MTMRDVWFNTILGVALAVVMTTFGVAMTLIGEPAVGIPFAIYGGWLAGFMPYTHRRNRQLAESY